MCDRHTRNAVATELLATRCTARTLQWHTGGGNPTLTSDALSVGSHEIACTVPAWPVSAQTIVPQLLYNGYPLKQSEQARDIAKKLGGTYKTKVICSSMNCTLYELCSFMNCTLYDYESPNYDCAPSILS